MTQKRKIRKLQVKTLDAAGLDLTAAIPELASLNGLTATAVELNKLDGATLDTAELNKLDGAGAVVPSGTQAAEITEVAITYTTNDPSITPNQAITIADGSAATAAELLEFCEELKANQDLIIAALEAFGITASS